ELLARMASQFGLGFGDLGKRRFVTPATLHFCDELIRLYGHEDYTIAAAASWAVENWAAAGFWDELVEGWRRYAERRGLAPFDIGFFTRHARLERNHARHTDDELGHVLRRRPVDEDVFVEHARQLLDGVLAFWRGLDRQRMARSEEAHHVAGGSETRAARRRIGRDGHAHGRRVRCPLHAVSRRAWKARRRRTAARARPRAAPRALPAHAADAALRP